MTSDILRETAHRPWPIPDRPWVMRMSWVNLLFAHWTVPAESLRAHLPEGLELDLYDGEAWVGVVPFLMDDVGARGLPGVPGTTTFPELNVRTYVVRDGKPGVWFLSLDADNRLAVGAARISFHLPYFHARMRIERDGDRVLYQSERRDRRLGPGVFRGDYGPIGAEYQSEPGSLEEWLTERYCLYSQSRAGTVSRADVHHVRWPLRRAFAEIETNTVVDAHGLTLPETPPLLHFVDRVDVVGWLPELCG